MISLSMDLHRHVVVVQPISLCPNQQRQSRQQSPLPKEINMSLQQVQQKSLELTS